MRRTYFRPLFNIWLFIAFNSTSQECCICFVFCCVLLWVVTNDLTHILQSYFTFTSTGIIITLAQRQQNEFKDYC